MLPDVEIKYLFEIRNACLAALESYRRINDPQWRGNAEQQIADVRHFLSDVALVSKLCWPPKSANSNRGDHLRIVLSIPDDNILKHRESRDDFEHMDERFDKWAKASAESALAICVVGSRFDYPQIDDSDFASFYDLNDDVLIIRGNRSKLGPLLAAVNKIQVSALQRITELNRT